MRTAAQLTILLAIFSIAAAPAAISSDTSSSAAWLSTIPGSMGDPFAGMMLTSPYFTIPKLNRFPPIIEGMPQPSVGYMIDDCPVVFNCGTSGPATLSEQSIYPGSSGVGGVSWTMPHNFSGPFFFDGYRSWFHGSSTLRFARDHSYTPPEYGFFAGPVVAAASAPQDSLSLLAARTDNRETSLDVSVPVARSLTIRGGGRIGYNGAAVRKWVEPYTSSGDFSYAPLFGDYSLSGAWKPSDRLDIRMHLIGAGERLEVRSTNDTDAIATTTSDHTINFGTAVNARLFRNLQSKSTVSLTTYNGSGSVSGSRFPGFGSDLTTTSTVTFTEKLSIITDLPVAPYLGIDTRKNSGTMSFSLPTALGSIGGDTIPDTGFAFAPFAGVHATPLPQWDMDVGFRFDDYHTTNTRHGSLLAISPRYELADSVNGNLCYRFHTSFELPDGCRLSLYSGTSSQLPTLSELIDNPDLSTIKSSRHSLTFAGTAFFGMGYRIGGYFNELWDVPMYPEPPFTNEYHLQSNGQLRCRGATVQVDHTFANWITAMLGYSIGSNDSRSADTAIWERTTADRRHKFNALLLGRLPFGLECGVNCMVTSGVPYTPSIGVVERESANGSAGYSPINGSLNAASGDPYCNLSASVNYTRRFGKLRIRAFIEGANLLQPSDPDRPPEDPFYTMSDPGPFSIDTRSVVFGACIEY